MWLTRTPLWAFLFTSTYNILLMTLERYAAVIYPHWYSNNVRTPTIQFDCADITMSTSK